MYKNYATTLKMLCKECGMRITGYYKNPPLIKLRGGFFKEL